MTPEGTLLGDSGSSGSEMRVISEYDLNGDATPTMTGPAASDVVGVWTGELEPGATDTAIIVPTGPVR
jgi:hypothetical protein